MRRPSAILEARPNNAGFTGSCTHCGNVASKEVHFSDDGVVIIEKYCAACSEPENFERLQAWYAKF